MPTAARRDWWGRARERAGASLFLLPAVGVVGAVVLAVVVGELDERLDTASLPLVFPSTLDSARVLLGTIATATISIAGIAFSVALLVIQRTSAQYSPRVVQTLFRDPFNRRVMAVVVGTFTYCMVVLRTVRDPGDGEVAVPHLSVSLALVLGVVAVLAVIAVIDHSAHAMDVSEILERVTAESVRQLEVPDAAEVPTPAGQELADVDLVVRFTDSGWVRHVDLDVLCALAPAGSVLEVRTAPGRYAVAGTPLCTVVGSLPTDPEGDDLGRRARAAVTLGRTRTLRQDPSYGIRQTVDVALRALSPGVNDPTTAQDAIVHTAALLVEVLRTGPPRRVVMGARGGIVHLPHLVDGDDLVDLACDEVRRAAATLPTVCTYLLDALHQVEVALVLDDVEVPSRLREQAALVVEGCAAADLLAEDVERVRRVHRLHFGEDVAAPQGARGTG